MKKSLKVLTASLSLCVGLLNLAPTTLIANAQTVNTVQSSSSFHGSVTINSDDVCLRSGHSTSSSIKRMLNSGDTVYLVKPKAQRTYSDGYFWIKVAYHTRNGYIYGYVAQDYIDY